LQAFCGNRFRILAADYTRTTRTASLHGRYLDGFAAFARLGSRRLTRRRCSCPALHRPSLASPRRLLRAGR
jgi:hypothetical protein